jgi:hypothetical protein
MWIEARSFTGGRSSASQNEVREPILEALTRLAADDHVRLVTAVTATGM